MAARCLHPVVNPAYKKPVGEQGLEPKTLPPQVTPITPMPLQKRSPEAEALERKHHCTEQLGKGAERRDMQHVKEKYD